jgi:menaquinone-9 beta-reductase
MHQPTQFDVIIAGGGLAGLASSILLAQNGISVAVIEKEKYPFHKVCGEYISMESWDFIERLGIPLTDMHLPKIDSLFLTSPNGKSFTTKLPLGGFGISRYLLDSCMAGIAEKKGVHFLTESKVQQVMFDGIFFNVSYDTKNSGNLLIRSKACFGAYGKRSNLDVKWQRQFLSATDRRLNNFVAVKYHVRTDWEQNIIGLHNFEDGYCGISKIEEDKYCVCYMTTAENLKKAGHDIQQLEQTILSRNPHLKTIFLTSEICESFPVTISQINFHQKTQVVNNILMLGDAAGMITPLCGNGMSIALHTAKLASEVVVKFLDGKISQDEMELIYRRNWEKTFAARLRTGRFLQRFFGSARISNWFVMTFRNFPFLAKPVIKMTHGEPF